MIKMIIRAAVWFCVGTVLAQATILGMSAAKGNLSFKSITQLIALINGIDISGQKLQAILEEDRKIPVPTYDDVVKQRANTAKDLDMRERALSRYTDQLKTMEESLKAEKKRFDSRVESFNTMLADMEKGAKDSGLAEIQRTLEAIAPDQAKEQLLRMLENGSLADVVAIIKGMPIDKRKKVIGEFSQPNELTKLAEILAEMRKGEPMASMIDEAKKPNS